MLPSGNDTRLRNHSSISKNSSFILAGGQKIEEDCKDIEYQVADELNNTLRTSQSIFDDQQMLNAEDSATFSRAPDPNHDNEPLKTQCDTRESQSFFISSQRHLSRKLKPPLTTNQNTKASLKDARGGSSMRGRGKCDRNSFQHENSEGLDISPFKNLGKTQTGISTAMG